MEGYCLLAERLRTPEERAFIKRVIEKHCKVKLDEAAYYDAYCARNLNH
jgi:midasin (ATPase involved in ribosome maturation)